MCLSKEENKKRKRVLEVDTTFRHGKYNKKKHAQQLQYM